MRNTAPQLADGQPLRINYKGLDGVGYVVIPPELIGHPTLMPFIPPTTIERLQALIDIVDSYNAAKEGGRYDENRNGGVRMKRIVGVLGLLVCVGGGCAFHSPR